MEVIRVLLAEADPGMCKLVEAFFEEQEGLCLCGKAQNGYEALELVEQERPHVLLLSLELPWLDGLAVLRRLRERPPEYPMSVVVVSCFADRRVVEYALSLGAQYYLIKPVSYRELLHTIYQLAETELVGLERWTEQLLREMLTPVGAGKAPRPNKGLAAAASAAVALAQEEGDKMLLKEAYYESIAREHTDYACVEKNIRYLVSRIHSAGSEQYRRVMGGMPTARPNNDTFLRALARRLRRQ